jgi:hypothetical protein
LPQVSLRRQRDRLHRAKLRHRRLSAVEPFPRSRVTLSHPKEVTMKGIIAWLLGVPLIVIILLYVFHIF